MAIASFLIPYHVALTNTLDGGYVGTFDVSPTFAAFSYFGLMMTIAGLLIGTATLRRRENKKRAWTWKANVIFQLISIPVIVGSIATPFLLEQGHDFAAVPFHNFFLLALSLAILALLLRSKTEAEHRLSAAK